MLPDVKDPRLPTALADENQASKVPFPHLVSIALLLALTAVLYHPVVAFQFVNYDDPLFVTDNHHVRAGLTWPGIRWAFSALFGFYNPLTRLSLMADTEIFGLDAGGFHFTNLFLHLINTSLFYCMVNRLTSNCLLSLLSAALFTFHPLNVESVAWISERKGLLSSMFLLLALHSYLSYLERRSLMSYAAAFVFFCGGLLSKSIVVTFPLTLIFLDILYRSRSRALKQPLARELRPSLLSKGPFLFVAGVFCYLTLVAQENIGAIQNHLSYFERTATGLFNYGFFFRKVLLPQDLSIHYPFSQLTTVGVVVGALTLIALVSLTLIALSYKELLVGISLLNSCIVLVPVVGFVQAGTSLLADRYSYLPLMWLSIAAAHWTFQIHARLPVRLRHVVPLVTGLTLTYLASQSATLIGSWSNSERLFEHAVSVNPSNDVAWLQLGTAFAAKEPLRAISAYETTLRLNPLNDFAHHNLAVTCLELGDTVRARRHFRIALLLNPNNVVAKNGLALLRL
jgi:tetratricopeptide (TPR) repeat protein